MRSLLTRAQLGLMRLIGLRKLREALDTKVDATQAHVLTMIEILQAASIERDRAINERFGTLEEHLIALSDQLSQQGGSATQRGDTDQNTFRAIQAKLDALLSSDALLSRDVGSSQALGELRAEMSGLRADLAREFEMLMDQNRGGDGPPAGDVFRPEPLVAGGGENRSTVSS